MSDAERLEGIEAVLDRLEELCSTHVLLIEGICDKRALEAVGIHGDFFMMQCSGGPVKAVEYVEEHGGRAVVLTDWDRRGDSLAQEIRQMTSGSTTVDFTIRDDLSRLCRRFIKDVESLDSLVARLSSTE